MFFTAWLIGYKDIKQHLLQWRPNAWLSMAIHLDSDFKEAINNFGVTLDKKTDFIGALEKYNKAISIDPDFYIGYVNLGITYRKLSESDKAKVAYEKALKLNPNSQEAQRNLGLLLEFMKLRDE